MFIKKSLNHNLLLKANPKAQDDSISTSGSSTPKKPYRAENHLKEKSELCRKFMEFGYCPYQKKCKFAHGSH